MKKLSLIVLVCMFAAALFACAPAATPTAAPATAAPANTSVSTSATVPTVQPAPTQGKPVTLNLWMVDGTANTKFIQQTVAAWNQANPDIQINLTMFELSAFSLELPIALASDTPPDFFYNWNGEKTNLLVREGYLLDMTPYIKEFHWDDGGIAPGELSSYKSDGKLWGLATSTEPAYFWYNKDIFAKYNLTPPATFDDLLTMCKTLKAAGVTPIALGDSEMWPAAHYMSILNQKVVGDKVVDADAELETPANQLFTDPNYVVALNDLLDMQKAGCFNAGVVGSDHNVEWSLFYTGKTAMEYDGTWVLSVWNQNGMQGKYGMFRFPSIPGSVGDPNEVLMGPIGLEILKSTKYPDQAAKFIDYYDNAANQRSMVDISQRIPVRASVVDPSKDDPMLVAVVKDIASASGSTIWQDASNDNAVVQVMYQDEQELLGGTKTAQQVMTDIHNAAVTAQAARLLPTATPGP